MPQKQLHNTRIRSNVSCPRNILLKYIFIKNTLFFIRLNNYLYSLKSEVQKKNKQSRNSEKSHIIISVNCMEKLLELAGMQRIEAHKRRNGDETNELIITFEVFDSY